MVSTHITLMRLRQALRSGSGDRGSTWRYMACEQHSAAVELLREQDTVLLQLQQGPFEVGGRWQVVKEG